MREEYLFKLCNIFSGKRNPQVESAFSASDGIPFVKMKDLGRYHHTTNLVETERRLKQEYAAIHGYKLIGKGAILLPLSGSVALNHRAILGIDAYIVNHLFALEVIDEDTIDNYYLYYYLLNLDLGLIANKTTGLDSISKERLGLIKIPLPSIDEQKRVSSILNIIQNSNDKRVQSIDHLNSFLRSIYFDMFGDPILNSKGWTTHKKLSELGTWRTGGTPDTSNDTYFQGNIPWFTSGELDRTYVNLSAKCISEKAIQNSGAKKVPSNSILIGMYDTAAFKMSINLIECSCNQAITYSKIEDQELTLYVYYSLFYSKEFYLNQRKGARQKNLNSAFIKKIQLFIPEHIGLIVKFNKIHALIENQKNVIKKSKEVLYNLFLSYLELLFLGKSNETNKLDDLINNDVELDELLHSFKQNFFVNETDYNIKKNLLFDLLEQSEKKVRGVYQNFINSAVELQKK